MRNGSFYTLAFNSTHYAVAAEKFLSEHIPITVMPTLRSISASCGISLRVEYADYNALMALLLTNRDILASCTVYEVNEAGKAEIKEMGSPL